MKFFEDIEIGTRTELGSYTFTAEDIKRFAERYDPQPFHTDEDAAKRSHFGGLVASGWHTASVFMKLQAQVILQRNLELSTTGVSPGFRNLRWLKPVYAGDTLRYSTAVTRKRELATRPQWGIVFNQVTAVNQHGEVALEIETSALFARRDASASSS
ncbi:MAG: MaoC family dehydratase [Bradyrhizobiaceae bacterium]|nr:MaoC family dehydratase [Bradyrhizobiaceae bacterium]